MSRQLLIKNLREVNPELSQSDLESVIDTFSKSVEKALLSNQKVEIRGFGTFFKKKIKEKYSARNPKTGEIIYVPEKNKVRFKPSKKLTKILNEKT